MASVEFWISCAQIPSRTDLSIKDRQQVVVGNCVVIAVSQGKAGHREKGDVFLVKRTKGKLPQRHCVQKETEEGTVKGKTL